MKMSVHESTDVDDQGTDEDTGAERSDLGQGECGPVGEADGSERAPYVATAGSIQRGGSSCRGSREQGEEACNHHEPEDTTEGDGVGERPICRTQPYPSDRDAGRARGCPSVTLHREADTAGGGRAEPPSPPSSQTLQTAGALSEGGDAAADRWEPPRLATGSGTLSDSRGRRRRRHRDGPGRPVQAAGGRPGLHVNAQEDHRAPWRPTGAVQ